MNKDIILQFKKYNASFVEDNLIINKFDKIFIFKEFEAELLRLFDGAASLKAVSEYLQEKYSDTYLENEFLDFVRSMVEKEILIEIV